MRNVPRHLEVLLLTISTTFILHNSGVSAQLSSGSSCSFDFECRNFACAYSQPDVSSTTERICCPEGDYIFVGPPISANVCTFQRDGSPCLGNRDELCASFVCIDGTCQPGKVDVGGLCDSDSDCRNWSCGKERSESDCIGQYCDGDTAAKPVNLPSICCPSGRAIDLGPPWGKVCADQKDGMPCRGEGRLCREGSICQWNDMCEKPLGRYQNVALTAPTRFLRIDEFVELQSSETENEYQYKKESEGEDQDEPRRRRRAQEIWDDASRFELMRAIREEKRWRKKYPFVLCLADTTRSSTVPESSRPEMEDEGFADSIFDNEPPAAASGFKKKGTLFDAVMQAESDAIREGNEIIMEEAMGRPSLEDGTDSQTLEQDRGRGEMIEIAGIPITPLYNDDTLFCGHTLMFGSLAQKISCDGCIVQPLLPTMKMMPRTIKFAEELMSAAIADYLDEDNEGTAQATKPVKELEDFPSAEVVSCAGIRTKSEFEDLKSLDRDGSGVVDTTQYANAFLSFVTGWGNKVAFNAIRENVYWGQEGAIGNEEYDKSRGFAWYAVLNYTVSESRCGDFYRTKLMWRTEISRSEKDFTFNKVYWNNTEVVEEDMYCILGFLIVMSVDETVCHIEITPPKRTSNQEASWLVQTGVENQTPFTDLGLDGSGQVVAISDTGIDTNNCYFWDSAQEIGPNHRKIVSYNPFADDVDLEWGHGTHTSATIAAKRSVDGLVESDGVADGIAPSARLAFLDIGDSQGQLKTPSDSIILETGRSEGAKIHSASWGAHAISYYSSQAKNFDDYVYNNDELLLVFAAGNDGGPDAPSSVDVPANAKNNIAVGATQSFGRDLERGQLGPAYLAWFSSRGPTEDGRIKPDILAPGSFLLSAGARPSIVGECDGNEIPSAGGKRDGLLSMEGTSMSTPVVSGSAALVRQYFEEGFHINGEKNEAEGISPSAALIKATLINGAQTSLIKGIHNKGGQGVTTTEAYDGNIGFGIIQLATSIYVRGKSHIQIKAWDREVIDDGDTLTYQVTIDKSNGCTFKSLSTTLVWFERGASMGCTRCLINDLDLTVTRDGDVNQTVYYPNGLDRPDNINNVERIVVDNVDDGETFSIRVRATNLDESSQKFSLVATGCFGGVGNELDTSNNVFLSDTATSSGGAGTRSSSLDLSNGAIIAIAVTMAVLLLCCVLAIVVAKRRSQAVGPNHNGQKEGIGEDYDYNEDDYNEDDHYGQDTGGGDDAGYYDDQEYPNDGNYYEEGREEYQNEEDYYEGAEEDGYGYGDEEYAGGEEHYEDGEYDDEPERFP